MAPINRSRPFNRSGFIRQSGRANASQRHSQISPDPEIIVDGRRLNKCLDSLEGLSGQ